MRITFVLPLADLSGGIKTTAIYARLLQQRGHRVTLVSNNRWAPPLRARVKALLGGRGWLRPAEPGPGHLDGLDLDHRRLERFRPVMDSDVPDADVVVATWWMTAEWVAALSARKGAKVHFIQGNEGETPGAPRSRVEATWRLPLHRIVVSRWLLEVAGRKFGVHDASYVPNGVDAQQFTAPPRGKQEVPAIGFVYSEDSIKGCDIAIAAFELALRRHPSLRLHVFGSKPVSAGLPLPPRAEFSAQPEQRRIPEIYASCDAWLWPSRSEGFGLPILEAMACRTPVIASPAGAAPDLLADGGGVLLPAPAVEPMAEGIERVCGLSEHEWRALSERARQVALGHGWEKSARLFERALQVAVERRSGIA